jgi:arginine/lysine/ornithine decarboxylase
MHMPGHANSNEITPLLNNMLQQHGGSKLEGSADEHCGILGNYFPATGALKESQDLATSLYGTKRTYYGINGSTGALISATRVLGGPTKKVLLPRNLHRSVIHGFRLTGASIKYIMPNYRPEFGVFEPISYDAIERALIEDADIDAIALTSPTYDGLSADIPRIA